MKKDAQAEQAVNELEVKKRSQLSYIWFRFRKNKLAMVGMFLLLVMALICVTAPLYLDYNDDVVTQHVMEKFTKPFSEGHILGTDHYGRDMFAPTVALMNSKPLPLSLGSTWILTWPYWPLPPD